MADHDESRDPRVSAGYRALGEQNPPEALDAAILAASRRAVGAGPRRAGASRVRRWALPVSIAAVVVLTMSIVVRIQLERPDLESRLPVPAAPPAGEQKLEARDAMGKAADAAKRAEAPQVQPKSKPQAAPPAAGERERQSMRAPAASAAKPAPRFVPEPPAERAPAPAESTAQSALGAASAPAPSGVAGARVDRAASEDVQAARRAASPAALEERAHAERKDESPHDWLERIARLRRDGRAKEADESLAEFRRRYPDYEIPKELREAVLGEAAR
ncbi:MAG: hypothetical protein R3357_01830 [Burkholderiales bacterium]|nr:hypothetical protein [Burkholderiales bacterium]